MSTNVDRSTTKLSITTTYTQVADSDYFTYTVSLNQPATRPITVNLTQPTNFPLTYEAVSSIDFAIGDTSKNSTINITQTYESQSLTTESNFTIELANGNNYTINTSRDDISVQIVNGNNLPVVNVTTHPATAIEGQNYDVVVGVVPSTHSGINLNYKIDDTDGSIGGFYQGVNIATNPYTLPANQGELTFEIMTNDVSGTTGHGKIAFELLPGTGYRLGSFSP